MKKLFAPIVLFALAGVLLSSCTNSSKLTFNKRHYRSGSFNDVAGKTHTLPNTEVASIPVKTTQQTSPIVKPENHVAANASVISTQKSEMSQNKTQENNPVVTSNSQKQVLPQNLKVTENPVVASKQAISETTMSQGDGGDNAAGAALSLLWIIIVVILILWLIGILAGGFGLGGLINLLLVIALILFILWLLRIW
jgi:hypothetical protein